MMPWLPYVVIGGVLFFAMLIIVGDRCHRKD